MSSDSHIQLNGVPVQDFIDAEQRSEIELARQAEIAETFRHRPILSRPQLGQQPRKRRSYRRHTKAEIAAATKIMKSVLQERAREWIKANTLLADSRLQFDAGFAANILKTHLRDHLEIKKFAYQGESHILWHDKALLGTRKGRRLAAIAPQTPEEATQALIASLPLPHDPRPLTPIAMPGSLRAEIHGMATAMIKLETRQARYHEKLARLWRGHASLWDQLIRRLSGT